MRLFPCPSRTFFTCSKNEDNPHREARHTEEVESKWKTGVKNSYCVWVELGKSMAKQSLGMRCSHQGGTETMTKQSLGVRCPHQRNTETMTKQGLGVRCSHQGGTESMAKQSLE